MYGYRNHIVLKTLLTAGLILAGYGFGFAQTSFEARPESKVWIEGSSTVHDFDCKSDSIEGRAELPRVSTTEDTVSGSTEYDIEIRFPVKEFDCGRSRMNRDFYEALKADDFSDITFKFHGAERLDDVSEGEDYQLYEVTGELSISGEIREISVQIKGKTSTENSTIRIFGSHQISMKDFGIDPPTAMMGMVKVHEELEVHFDLYVDQK